jgi:hypothetical protein
MNGDPALLGLLLAVVARTAWLIWPPVQQAGEARQGPPRGREVRPRPSSQS